MLNTKTLSTPILLVLLILQTKNAFTAANTEETSLRQHPEPTEAQALKLKFIAIASILASSALGICTPILLQYYGKTTSDGPVFFLFKAFGAGVILSTGFIHILPDAFSGLSSPLLEGTSPWADGFPLAGLISMSSVIATFLLEAFATAYRRRVEMAKSQPLDVVVEDEREADDERVAGIVHLSSDSSDRIRHRLISQVLELGILVHSVIIGMSLGASQSTKTIKPLVAALSFHQFFEGMGLGGCISQMKKADTTTLDASESPQNCLCFRNFDIVCEGNLPGPRKAERASPFLPTNPTPELVFLLTEVSQLTLINHVLGLFHLRSPACECGWFLKVAPSVALLWCLTSSSTSLIISSGSAEAVLKRRLLLASIFSKW